MHHVLNQVGVTAPLALLLLAVTACPVAPPASTDGGRPRPRADAGPGDGGVHVEGGTRSDGGAVSDGGAHDDSGTTTDAGALGDGGAHDDSGTTTTIDAGAADDGGGASGGGDPPAATALDLVDSPLYVNEAVLELAAVDASALSVLPTPVGDADGSTFTTVFVYREPLDPTWAWLRVAVFVPPADVARLPADGARVQLLRTGPWVERGGSGVVEVAAGLLSEALEGPADVCGSAAIAARFDLAVDLDGDGPGTAVDTITDVKVFAERLAPTGAAPLAWLDGCAQLPLP